ncbi:Aminomethyltransferase [Austwickia sp. TVS 96-490-7B]|uniref:CAF17-like 4Fe-4S cluster assembly/insertion protein YgfZ n=1 Tax=Austwickia sp. TVS 96-490-7B TaxID=2830843 RepID=UPI001C58C44D|nr:folate-binding protein [Austwickia sp. TVS 96-490-7B]MBW3083857.1 Aminomethyltransferase [Austwickia sp. TVS 96-490-7B]
MRSPLLDRPGAVEADGVDAGVAAHYGDPLREQRALLAGEAVVDLSHRGVVTVSGPDRLTWLHSLTTQHLTEVAAGVGTESLVLSPHGHIEHALHLVDDGATAWITVEPGTAGALTAWLDSMRFMLRVEVTDVSDQYAVLGVAAEVDADRWQLAGPTWVDPWPGPVGDTATYGPVADHPAAGRRWRELLVARANLAEVVGDQPMAGSWAAEAERIAAWRPRCGVDSDHRTIPHELDWLRTAVHLHKGCYRGQETVARVHNLGRPPRRLVFCHLDGSGHVLPEAGAELRDARRVVGRLTSVARHHEDGPVALAVVRRATDPDAVLHAGEVTVAQTTIVRP